MKKDIVLCGVGGDGIVSVAKIISDAALNMGMNLKQSEIHGMSQRGGSVFSHLRISDNEIFADVIPEGNADIILSSEPMEALRYLPWLSKEGWVITNNDPFVNISNYPDMEKINAELGKLEHVVSFNANEIAKQLKARSNMVLLGATVPYLGISMEKVEEAIRQERPRGCRPQHPGRACWLRPGNEVILSRCKRKMPDWFFQSGICFSLFLAPFERVIKAGTVGFFSQIKPDDPFLPVATQERIGVKPAVIHTILGVVHYSNRMNGIVKYASFPPISVCYVWVVAAEDANLPIFHSLDERDVIFEIDFQVGRIVLVKINTEGVPSLHGVGITITYVQRRVVFLM